MPTEFWAASVFSGCRGWVCPHPMLLLTWLGPSCAAAPSLFWSLRSRAPSLARLLSRNLTFPEAWLLHSLSSRVPVSLGVWSCWTGITCVPVGEAAAPSPWLVTARSVGVPCCLIVLMGLCPAEMPGGNMVILGAAKALRRGGWCVVRGISVGA